MADAVPRVRLLPSASPASTSTSRCCWRWRTPSTSPRRTPASSPWPRRSGYALGIFLLVPLGDVVERRALMMRMFAAVSLALFAVAFAPSLSFSSLPACSSASSPLSRTSRCPSRRRSSRHEKRGRALGMVMTGLLLGILLARTFAGWVSEVSRWQVVFITAGCVNALFVPLLWKVMPRLEPTAPVRYGEALRSLWTLFRTPAAAARVLVHRRAGLRLVQHLLDHAGLSAGQALRPRPRRGRQLRRAGSQPARWSRPSPDGWPTATARATSSASASARSPARTSSSGPSAITSPESSRESSCSTPARSSARSPTRRASSASTPARAAA